VVTGISAGESECAMIEHSDQISNLAASLLKAQKAIGVALKNAKNPYYKSKYADLKTVIDAVKEPLNANGITFLQAVDMNSEGIGVVDTILLHESGQFMSARTPIYCLKENDPQALGKGISYSKRYALQALLGLPTEDDDAEAAIGQGQKKNGWGKSNKENGQPPKLTANGRGIIERAYDQWGLVHKDDIPKGSAMDYDKFQAAVFAMHNKWPTKEESVIAIVDTIKAKDVISEIKTPTT